MDFIIPEEIEMLRSSLRKFIEKEVIPMEEEAGYDPDDGAPQELLKKVRKRSYELGFWAIDLPEEYGGGGLNTLGTVILREEVSKYFCSLTQAIFGGPEGPSKIILSGTEEQIQNLGSVTPFHPRQALHHQRPERRLCHCFRFDRQGKARTRRHHVFSRRQGHAGLFDRQDPAHNGRRRSAMRTRFRGLPRAE